MTHATISQDSKIKVLVIGEENVGKSNIVLRFTKDVFVRKGSQVVPSEYLSKSIEIPDIGLVQFDINDPFGEDRFRDLTSSHYRYVSCVLIVFDVTDRESFNSIPCWIHETTTLGPRTVNYFLVANKVDSDARVITENEGKKLAETYKCQYIEVSAMYNMNISKLFECAATEILEKRAALAPANTVQKGKRKRRRTSSKLVKGLQILSPRMKIS